MTPLDSFFFAGFFFLEGLCHWLDLVSDRWRELLDTTKPSRLALCALVLLPAVGLAGFEASRISHALIAAGWWIPLTPIAALWFDMWTDRRAQPS